MNVSTEKIFCHYTACYQLVKLGGKKRNVIASFLEKLILCPSSLKSQLLPMSCVTLLSRKFLIILCR